MKIKKLFDDVVIPQYATEGSAGFDLVAHNFKQLHDQYSPSTNIAIIGEGVKSIALTPHSRILIGCGFAVAVPKHHELQIRSRSGNALKKGLVVLNSPGTIDSDYRGEVGVILYNASEFAIEINLGDKIAQAVLAPYCVADLEVVEELSETQRGEGGFGSTGK